MKKKLAFILSVMMFVIPLGATTLKDKKNELESAQQHIADKEAQLDKKTKEKEAIKEEIKQVDIQIVSIQDKIKELEQQLDEKKNEIAQSEKELASANDQKDIQYEATKSRMRQMYKNQKVGYLQVIFSSNSFWEAINRIEYMRCISKKDNSILDEYEAQIESIEEQKAKIEEEKNDLDLLQKQAIVKNNELEESRNKKSDAINRLAEEEGKLKSEIENLEEISEEIKAEIKRLTEEAERKAAEAAKANSSNGGYSSNFPSIYEGGTFLWPVPGYYRISSDYVNRTSPIFGTAEFHTGIDIPAGYGENVVAAGDGVVITAGWVNGYGNTVMISHGSGLVTLYGHNSSLVVNVGQSVKQGQTIAKIGSTGYSTGNHCHFEVRLNGDHTSPWPYLNN